MKAPLVDAGGVFVYPDLTVRTLAWVEGDSQHLPRRKLHEIKGLRLSQHLTCLLLLPELLSTHFGPPPPNGRLDQSGELNFGYEGGAATSPFSIAPFDNPTPKTTKSERLAMSPQGELDHR